MSGFLCIFLTCYANNTLGHIKQLISLRFFIKGTMNKVVTRKAMFCVKCVTRISLQSCFSLPLLCLKRSRQENNTMKRI